jgi:hypothetical protein
MSEKRYVVPEEMLDAATAVINADMSAALRSDMRWPGVNAILKAAIRWQSEHPQVPTEEQMDALTNDLPYQDSGNGRIFRVVIDRWQRHMYDAPEPVFDATLGGALMGRTFTREQADAMKYIIDTSVHDSAHDLDATADGEEPTKLGNKYRHLEPEVQSTDFGEEWNACTVEINRVGGVRKAAEILRAYSTPEPTKSMCPLCQGSGTDDHANEPSNPFQSRFAECGYCKGKGMIIIRRGEQEGKKSAEKH